MSKATDSIYISHYLFRNMPKEVRDGVLRCAYRDDVIGKTIAEARDVIISGAAEEGVSEKDAKRIVKDMTVALVVLKSEEGRPAPKAAPTKKVTAKATKTASKTVKTADGKVKKVVKKTRVASASRNKTAAPAKRVARKRK